MTDAPRDPLIGQTFRGCRVLRRLGAGGMGTVYLAYHRGLDKKVALKFLAPHQSRNPEWLARFVREARMAARLEHPNIVQVLDVAQKDQQPFIVMQYVDGETLGARLARAGPLPPAQVLELGLRAARALGVAHAAGIVHRDIKPDNLMLTADGTLKIMDFGLAKPTDDGPGSDVTRADALVGSPHFMAPELADGAAPGPQSDIYSLGVTLYYLATGVRPFDGRTPLEVVLRHREHQPPPAAAVNAAVPAPLSEAIARMMARDPALRPADAAALRALLVEAKRASVGTRAVRSAPVRAGPGLDPGASEEMPEGAMPQQEPSTARTPHPNTPPQGGRGVTSGSRATRNAEHETRPRRRFFTPALAARLRAARPKLWTTRRVLIVTAVFALVGGAQLVWMALRDDDNAALDALAPVEREIDAARWTEARAAYDEWRAAFPQADDRGLGARLIETETALEAARTRGWAALERFELDAAEALFARAVTRAPAARDCRQALLELAFLRQAAGLICVPGGLTEIGAGGPEKTDGPRHRRVVPTFFVEAAEFRRADYEALRARVPNLPPLPERRGRTGGAPADQSKVAPGEDDALPPPPLGGEPAGSRGGVGGGAAPDEDPAGDEARLPVTGLSYADAERCVAARGLRLTTELEWERAARGQDDDPERPRGRALQERLLEQVTPRPSRFGVTFLPLVSEWTASRFEPYPGAAPDAGPFDPAQQVVRGHAGAGLRWTPSVTARRGLAPDQRPALVGFRGALSLPVWSPPESERARRLAALAATLAPLAALGPDAAPAALAALIDPAAYPAPAAGDGETGAASDRTAELLFGRWGAKFAREGLTVRFDAPEGDALCLGARVTAQVATPGRGGQFVRTYETIWRRTPQGWRLVDALLLSGGE